MDGNSRDRLIAKVEMSRKKMYPLQVHRIQGMMKANFKVEALDQTWLCHLRYGHLHFDGLSLLQKKNMVKGLPPIITPINSCESCIMEK